MADPAGRPMGRAASPNRPGLFIKDYLSGQDAPQADIFRALKDNIEQINEERSREVPAPRPIKGSTYNSFARYFAHFTKMGFVERTGVTEPSSVEGLEDRVFYRITPAGAAASAEWLDPAKASMEE